MPTNRQLTVEVTPTERDRGKSDTASMQAEFPASPIHNGELTKDVIRAMGNEFLIIGVVDDGGHLYNNFDRDYPDSPNLAEVTTDRGGQELSSPYAPSLASPPGGVDDWANQPATPEETNEAGGGSSGPFPGNGKASPHDGAVVVSRQTIGGLFPGTSTPSSTS